MKWKLGLYRGMKGVRGSDFLGLYRNNGVEGFGLKGLWV